MDVVLITARAVPGAQRRTQDGAVTSHWSQAVGAALAAQLAAAADLRTRVHWLCPLGSSEPGPPPIPGVEIAMLRGRSAPFRKVLERVSDAAVDVALARALRPLRSALVAHIGFGAPGSAATLWIAERMGARVVAVVRAAEVLCHRGTLVDADGARCERFLEAARCAACACAPWSLGLSPLQSRLARWLRPLRGWSPFPSENGFLSRADLVLASLQLATVVVADDRQGQLLQAAGITARNVRVVGSGDAAVSDRAPDARAVAAEIAAICAAAGSR